ncbi:OmpA family protein [bacterium]|nr:OmpA family protein [bacterium]
MGKKKAEPEEQANLGRWMVSYADFVTLLFATFVVLYALSQVDIKAFSSLENSIKQAFSAPSLLQGSQGVLNDGNNLMDQTSADSMIEPLMMEYISQKYEQEAYSKIENDIKRMEQSGELSGVEVSETDQGLIIRFGDDYLFPSGSATIYPSAKSKLDKVGAVIAKRFILHYMKIEGHTDNRPILSSSYPSNWELSSARASAIVRYMIGRFSFMPSLFSATGYAETRPVAPNTTDANRAKNRRVEILILRNRNKSQVNPQNEFMKMSKQDQEAMERHRIEIIAKIQRSPKEEKLIGPEENHQEEVILNKQLYNKEVLRLSRTSNGFDEKTKVKITGQGDWLRPPASKGKD